MSITSTGNVGSVVIGRNEGARLKKCLQSITAYTNVIVYVDSGSTDDSVNYARSIGVESINLDMSLPFTAARARNEGFFHLLQMFPDLEYVQFVDGDCEIVEGWFVQALETLQTHKDAAIVCGRRRERHPDASIYNRFCDIEWNTPIGEADACGGDALIRVTPFQELGGFNPALIAGEEPELCVRLRLAGWRIHRIDSDMTLHDASMHHVGQWWKRTMRTGHAYAEGYALHGHTVFRHYARPLRSILIWGFVVPVFCLISLITTYWTAWALIPLALCMFGYAKIIWRSYAVARIRGASRGEAFLYGTSIVLAKFPQLAGALRYYKNKMTGKTSSLIEYKGT